jgi:branched-chain amino acid aminotransferase
MNNRLVYINGKILPEREAKISVYDTGLMYGEICFEMTRSFNGKQFLLRQHLERLYRGIKQLQIPVAETLDQMKDLVNMVVDANKDAFLSTDEHRIMINVSRGILPIYQKMLGQSEATVCICDFPVKYTVAGIAHLFDDGVHAVTPLQRAIPSQYLENKIKNRSRIHYQVANQQVALLNDPNVFALLLDPDGFIAEGTGSNFFIVKDGVLITSEGRNVLRGTRRQFLLDLAKELHIPTSERNIELYDVIHADEAFFCSTAFSMLPCTKINGMPIGNGRRGEMFNLLLKEWSVVVEVDIEVQTKMFAAEVNG